MYFYIYYNYITVLVTSFNLLLFYKAADKFIMNNLSQTELGKDFLV